MHPRVPAARRTNGGEGELLNLFERYWTACKNFRDKPMTDSTSSLLAILLGLGVFAIIVAIGWRSVQNRRILRMRGADGRETIIVAREDDDVSSVTTIGQATQPAPAPDVGGTGTEAEPR
jgi:hypothetical protein